MARAAWFLFWPMLAFAGVMALLPKPPKLPIDALGDKWEHALAFAVLTLLAQLSVRAKERWRVAERLSFFGALIELAQSIPALHRDCDIRDWLVDTAVILAVTALFVAAKGGAAKGRAGRR